MTDITPVSVDNLPLDSALTDVLGNRTYQDGISQTVRVPVQTLANLLAPYGTLVSFATRAQMDAKLAYGEDTGAYVWADPTAANNGIWRKLGASGAGSWTRVADLPAGLIAAGNAGAGTANAIAATSSWPVSDGALVLVNVTATNTASPVTIAFNAGAALTVRTLAGNAISPGGLVAGAWMLGVKSGTTFRLLSDHASAAIQAAAEAARDKAQAWAESATAPDGGATKSSRTWASVAEDFADTTLAALAGVTTVNAKYQTVAAMLASTEASRGVSATWEAGGYRYLEAASGASDNHLVTAGGIKLYVLPCEDGSFHAAAFSIASSTSTDQTARVQTAITAAAGLTLRFPQGAVVKVYATKVSANTVIDLNGATIRRRHPVAGVDSDNLAAWTGSSVYYNTTSYAPIFYLTGDNITFLNGIIDGDRANDTIGRPTGGTGGSHEGGADRSAICGSRRAVSTLNTVRVDNVQFVNMLSTSLNLDGITLLTLKRNRFTNCVSTTINANGALQGATAAPAGSLAIVENNVWEGNPLSWGLVPQEYIFTAYRVLNFHGNLVDGREKLTSIFGGNPADSGKIQYCNVFNTSGNTHYDSGYKVASGSGFTGDSFSSVGDKYIASDTLISVSGIGGGSAVYNSVNVQACTFKNCGVTGIELAAHGTTISGNTFRATRTMGFAIGLLNNLNIAPGNAVVSGNVIDLGGYDGNVAFFAPHKFAVALIEGNTITNVDHVWSNLSSPDFSASRLKFKNNTIFNHRTMGRFYFASIAEMAFDGNDIGSQSSTSPTSYQGYNGRAMNITFNGGAWGVFRYAKNQISDTSTYFTITNDVASGSTVTNFIVRDNEYYAAAAAYHFDFANSTAMTVTNVVIKGNTFNSHCRVGQNWTVTNWAVLDNFFINPLLRIYNASVGNIGWGAGTATSATAGGATALPSLPAAYRIVQVEGGVMKIPLYNT